MTCGCEKSVIFSCGTLVFFFNVTSASDFCRKCFFFLKNRFCQNVQLLLRRDCERVVPCGSDTRLYFSCRGLSRPPLTCRPPHSVKLMEPRMEIKLNDATNNSNRLLNASRRGCFFVPLLPLNYGPETQRPIRTWWTFRVDGVVRLKSGKNFLHGSPGHLTSVSERCGRLSKKNLKAALFEQKSGFSRLIFIFIFPASSGPEGSVVPDCHTVSVVGEICHIL